MAWRVEHRLQVSQKEKIWIDEESLRVLHWGAVERQFLLLEAVEVKVAMGLSMDPVTLAFRCPLISNGEVEQLEKKVR